MDNDPINLKDYKNKKKAKKVISDIDNIIKIIDLTQKSLSYYKTYVSVQEIISILETNRTFLNLSRKKYKSMLE